MSNDKRDDEAAPAAPHQDAGVGRPLDEQAEEAVAAEAGSPSEFEPRREDEPEDARLTDEEDRLADEDFRAEDRDRDENELAAGLDSGSYPDDADREAARARPEETVDPYPEEAEPDEHARSSLAARALQALVILLIGAALALWALPRVAPNLPAPVAQWFAAPDAVAAEDLDALRAEMDAASQERVAALESRVAELEGGPDLAPVTDRLDAVEARVEEIASARTDGLEETVADLRQRLDSLSRNLTDVGGAADLPPEAAERIAAFSSVTEELRGRMEQLSQQVSSLADRIEQAEARAQQAEADAGAAQDEADAADRRAALSAGFRDIQQALDEGQGYEDALTRLQPYAEAPEGVTAGAAGVPTMDALRARYTDAARRALQAASLAQAEPDFFNQAVASLRARLSGVPVAEVEGDGLEAMIGRAAVRLREGDLEGALAALDGLPPEAQEAMADWLSDARARRAAVRAVDGWRAETLGE